MQASPIDSLNPSSQLSESQNCLEFLLLSFCRTFSLEPRQAAGLLTQSGRYLSYVIMKGFKGQHAVIVTWYQTVYTHIRHMARLMEYEEDCGSMPLMLSTLKTGFLSKKLETALWCCRVHSRLASEFLDMGLDAAAWDWFV